MERKGRNLSYNAGRKQAEILLGGLLSFVEESEESEESKDCKANWQAGTELWVTHSTLEGLAELTKKYNDSLDVEAIRNALNCLISLKILQDKRGQTNAKTRTNSKVWLFALKFPSIDKKENLNWLFKQGGEWDKCREAQKNNSAKVPKTPKEKSQGVDWQEICGAMLEKHKRLTTNELLFADNEMKFELKAIHVPLALVERNKPKKCSEDISAEQGSQLYEPSYEEKQRFEHKAFLEQVIRDGVGKTQGHRIALIGEPGAGKTTQLQTIAFWILNKNLGLPIWISLADLQKSLENYLLQVWLKNALEVVRVTEEQENAFVDLFKNNRVWLLLDAADEMSSLQPLTEISQQLTGWVKNARVVLTCRVNVWEVNGGALADFETYRLLNFEYPGQVQDFIGRWFHNKNADKGEKLWKELDKAERQRIQDLVKNPLRLALLCSTWQFPDKGLPETKAGLYQQFVKRFYTWRKNRFSTTQKQQKTLNAALGRLARRAIDTETSRFRLRHEFVSNELGDPEEEGSLFWLALKLGWLNQVGLAAESDEEEVYAFYHPTFEEYFAALAVENWHEFLNHVPDNPTLGVYRIFAPQWKEVILLWLGREDVGREEKEEFIQVLVEFDDGCGEYRAIDRVRKGFYEFRAYFLAAAGIDEWKNSGNADAIVAKIVKWGFGEFKVEQKDRVRFLEPIAEGAKTALPQTNRIKAIDALVELIGKPQLDYYTRWQAVESLGQIGSSNQKAIDALVELIGKPQLNDDSRRQVASSLGKIGSGNEKAIDALVELIANTQLDYSTRWQAVSSLGGIGSGNEKAIAALVELIDNPQLDDDTRRQVASSLGKIGSGNEKAIAALVELIGNPQLDKFTRRQVASSLGEIGSGNEKAIAALVELIGNPQLDYSTRMLAVSSLEKIDPGNEKAIAALVELIGNPQLDYSTRMLAAESLGEIGSGNEKVIAALVELIGNGNPQLDDLIRRQVAESLGKIDPGNEKAIAALVELIGNPQLYELTRILAAESLGKIGSGNEKAITGLVELISNPQLYDSTRTQAAKSLGQIGSGNEKAIAGLVELIGNPQLDYSTQWKVGSTLEKILLEEQMPSVITVLKDYLSPETYKNYFKRFDDCYEVIWKCAQSMPYPAFYQAWHQQDKVKDGE
ncbi:MAG TPA: HEAT repeat domain-containing protein [Nostoc sp.]|uniref:HEAT repeat domain-containing protein n=1 Tax=Nostoc sp. TaxID=1180 RepID=UPI002D4F6B16|nr:HEAT repeat domain-containing protein [Nostoc sp.]HYX17758.1 HEAT repeat domain-containing protein [Nostoc sp.]